MCACACAPVNHIVGLWDNIAGPFWPAEAQSYMFCIIALSKTSVVKLYTCVNVMGWNKMMLKWIEYFKVWISEVFILHNHISITEIRQQATLNYSSLHYDLPFSGDKQQPRLHYFKLRLSNHIFKCFPSLPHYLFSDELSFSLLAGASCRSGRLAKSSCSARPMARERTTIFPSLDTQRTHTLTTEQYTHTHKRIPDSFFSEEK